MKPTFDPKFKHLFYSYVSVPHHLLRDKPMQWKAMPNHSLQQILDTIIADIMCPIPKMMTVACFDLMITKHSNDEILEGITHLIKLVKDGGIHHISVGTLQFPPDYQEIWLKIGQINAQIRILNIERGVPPLSMHKALMKPRDEFSGPLIVKGAMWKEYLAMTGLGSALSRAGIAKIVHFAFLACGLQFTDMPRRPSSKWIGLLQPPRLCVTEGYADNSIMCDILRARGLYNVRPNSTSNIPSPDVQQPPRRLSLNDVPAPVIEENDYQIVNADRQVIPEEQSMEQDQSQNNSPVRSEEDRNYNESEQQQLSTTSQEKMDKLFTITSPTVESLKSELRKIKLSNIMTTKENKDKENKLQGKIKKLYDDLEAVEATVENQAKKISKQKKELEKLKLEVETQKLHQEVYMDEMEKVTRKKESFEEQLQMKTDQYDFLKTLYTDTVKIAGKHLTERNSKDGSD